MALRASMFSTESIFLINFKLLCEFGEGTIKQLVNAEMKDLPFDSMVHSVEKQISS
jgi:hypothetical protein